jgi:hypothetical protein
MDAGMCVVGASSLAEDEARSHYSEWQFLPWIGDADFAPSLGRCVAGGRFDLVYTSHPVVWSVLRELLPKLAPLSALNPNNSGLRSWRTTGNAVTAPHGSSRLRLRGLRPPARLCPRCNWLRWCASSN